jgi:hypothetical protein
MMNPRLSAVSTLHDLVALIEVLKSAPTVATLHNLTVLIEILKSPKEVEQALAELFAATEEYHRAAEAQAVKIAELKVAEETASAAQVEAEGTIKKAALDKKAAEASVVAAAAQSKAADDKMREATKAAERAARTAGAKEEGLRVREGRLQTKEAEVAGMLDKATKLKNEHELKLSRMREAWSKLGD